MTRYNISVKNGRSLATASDYANTARNKKIIEKERSFINALDCRISGYDVKRALEKETKLRKNLLKYYINQERIEELENRALKSVVSEFKAID